MVSDGKIDGTFLVKSQQSFYNAISNELGLTENEMNKLSGSVWDNIYSILNEDENTSQINLDRSETPPVLVTVSKNKFKEIIDLVNKNLNKNIKMYDEEAIDKTYKKIKVELSAVKAEDLAKDLKAELQSSWVNQSDAKKMLSKINPGNIMAILESYPEIADDIDGVFGFGFGFDKNEVYNHILKPLLYRAKELDIYTDENLSAESSLEEIKSAINHYKSKIANVESQNKPVGYQTLQRNFDKANKFLAELATGNINANKVIQNTKYEGKTETSKTIELEDGRYVFALYNASGEIQEIRIKANNSPEITYTESNAGPEDQFNARGFNPVVTSRDYDFNSLKKVITKLFEEMN